MIKCSQCDKPAIVQIGNNPLCVDCNLKLQQAIKIRNDMLAEEMNYLTEQMETTVGLYGILPRYKITQPVVHQGDLTFNNIRVDKSIIGTINTGNIQSIDMTMSNIKISGDEQLAKAIGEFTQAVINETKVSMETRNQILEQLSFLTSQYELPKEKRKPTIIKNVLSAIKDTISTIADLVTIWSVLEPLLTNILL